MDLWTFALAKTSMLRKAGARGKARSVESGKSIRHYFIIDIQVQYTYSNWLLQRSKTLKTKHDLGVYSIKQTHAWFNTLCTMPKINEVKYQTRIHGCFQK